MIVCEEKLTQIRKDGGIQEETANANYANDHMQIKECF